MTAERRVATWSRRLILGFSMAIPACGGNSGAPPVVKVYGVKGSVLLADGRPLPGGRIYFVPEGGAMTSEGRIGPDGSYSLETGASGEGAPEGTFKVRVEPSDPSVFASAGAGRGKKLPFPARYLDEDSSLIKVTIKPESNTLEPIRLK